MSVQRIAAFTKEGRGGNPAGVVIAEEMPAEAEMRRIAAEVGYSETAFAAREPDGTGWRVRYFSPESEVPFCGHATIALGAALTERHGPGRFALRLNDAEIEVEGRTGPEGIEAVLRSPPTRSAAAPAGLLAEALALFGYAEADLDPRLAPRTAHAGANHLIIPLAARGRLAAMTYDLDAGRAFMNDRGLVTVAFVVAETDRLFHARNAFASGGVLEDPATGAAAAALGGMLRDAGWPHGGGITILQGEDMGRPSELFVSLTDAPGAPVSVRGRTAAIEDAVPT